MTDDTLLYRGISPALNRDEEGYVNTYVFMPTFKDNGLLSVFNGELVDAGEALRRRRQLLMGQGRNSEDCYGICAVSLGECRHQQLEEKPDLDASGPDDPHFFIDFKGLDGWIKKKKPPMSWKVAAALLAEYARNRSPSNNGVLCT